jgi:hypothetical protein
MVGINASSILVSMKTCKILCIFVSWCLAVGIGVSNILVSTNM